MTGVIDKVKEVIDRGASKDRTGSRQESTDRGRIHSTGRGGAGNAAPGPVPAEGETSDEERAKSRSRSRGRPDHPISTGIGGRGNVRSPSRNPEADRIREEDETVLERSVERRRKEEEAGVKHGVGRGGAGNVH